MSFVDVSRAIAADNWETWPKKTTVPGVEPNPARDAYGAAKAEDAEGKKTATGISAGTIGWIALAAAAVIGIAIAAGRGGSGDGGGVPPNPGHH